MADKSFALKVELQGDVEKFKKNMDQARAKSAQFAKGVQKSGQAASRGFGGITTKVNGLSGALAAAGGGQGVGLLTQALSSIASPAGLATAAIAGVAMMVRRAQEDMRAFENSLDAVTAGASAYRQTAKDTFKDIKSTYRGMARQAEAAVRRENNRQSELIGLKQAAYRAGDHERFKELKAEQEQSYALMKLKKAEAKEARRLLSETRGLLDNDRRDTLDNLAEVEAAYRKVKLELLDAKTMMRELMAEMAGESVNLMNTLLSDEKRGEAAKRMQEHLDLYTKQLAVFDDMIVAVKARQALSPNDHADAEELRGLQAERASMMRSLARFQKQVNAFQGKQVKTEKVITEEKEKQVKAEHEMLKLSKSRASAGQARGATADTISYAGAGVAGTAPAAGLVKFKEDMEMLIQDLDFMIQDFLAGSIADLAGGIGEALATGNFDSMGKRMLSSLGGFFKQIGAMFIAYGVANLAFIQALASVANPVSAIALIGAGAALVAIGGAIGGAAKSFGGSGASGGAAISGGYSTQQGDNVVKFEIEGDKLKGVLDNNDRKSKNYG